MVQRFLSSLDGLLANIAVMKCLWKVLVDQTIRVLIRPTLATIVRVCKVKLYIQAFAHHAVIVVGW